MLPRVALRTAQQQAAGAAQTAKEAGWLHQRALAQVAESEAALSVFAELDTEVVGWRASVLKAGGVAARALMLDGLVAARRARAEAEQDRADATATASLLATDAQVAGAAAQAAAEAVRLAVDAAVQQEGTALLVKMRAAEAVAARLRVLMTSLGGGRTGADPTLAWPLVQLQHEPLHAVMLDGMQPDWNAAATAWSAFRTALAADPDAVFTA